MKTIVNIRTLKEMDMIKRDNKNKCIITNHQSSDFAIYLKDKDYYKEVIYRGYPGNESDFKMDEIFVAPGATSDDIKRGLLILISDKIRKDLDMANQLLDELRTDGVMKDDDVEIPEFREKLNYTTVARWILRNV